MTLEQEKADPQFREAVEKIFDHITYWGPWQEHDKKFYFTHAWEAHVRFCTPNAAFGGCGKICTAHLAARAIIGDIKRDA
jgi:hypothetical protein